MNATQSYYSVKLLKGLTTCEIESLEPRPEELWPGAGNLLTEALVLVTDNAQAGRINGVAS